MATTDRANRQWLGGIALAGLAITLAVILILSFRTQPQMGPDDEVFDTVDALYTAVRNQDSQQLGACEAKLTTYREAGKLPAPAADKLAGIIVKAHGGSWETAAERLYDFMAAQKREGYAGHPRKHEDVRKKK